MTTSTVHDITSIPAITGSKTIILFWAPWQEESVPGGVCDSVLQALAASADGSLMVCRVQAEDCPTVTNHYKITAVPTFVLLDASGSVFERIEGSQDLSQVTRAVQKLLALPTQMVTEVTNTVATVLDEEAKKKKDLQHRLQSLTHVHPVMLFIKGTPDAPKCGFSKQAVQMLQENNIAFGSFDILTDDQVRQGLKELSDWPTYPQLYVNGELMGGLDIMKELQADTSSSLQDHLGLSATAVPNADPKSNNSAPALSLNDRLYKLVRQEKIMLFMKGLPSAPQCGFSRQMVQLLKEHSIHHYGAFDILSDAEVRQGLKEYSDWPTYPQLYVNGELIGGLDIVQEMSDDGTLQEALSG
jgi:Grx4 family monothiol glutaredoxin